MTYDPIMKARRTLWNMNQRCFNPKNAAYARYGGRGITVCDRWRHSFKNFLTDMGPPPAQHLSIDRINNDGNYEPGNCRWATREEQAANQTKGGCVANKYKATHCTSGHEFTPENTYITNRGRRHCRECQRQISRRIKIQRTAVLKLLDRVPLPPDAITWECGVELLNELQRLAVERKALTPPSAKGENK